MEMLVLCQRLRKNNYRRKKLQNYNGVAMKTLREQGKYLAWENGTIKVTVDIKIGISFKPEYFLIDKITLKLWKKKITELQWGGDENSN